MAHLESNGPTIKTKGKLYMSCPEIEYLERLDNWLDEVNYLNQEKEKESNSDQESSLLKWADLLNNTY